MTSTPSPSVPVLESPPNSPHQSEKSKRYDRQLRLWGDHGQTSLEKSSVCLVNATAAGTEILKSLVLPGLGSFTIIDNNKVKGEDAGNNFFVTADDIGDNRGEVTTKLLLEMNHDVTGDFVDESVEQVLEQNPDFFKRFSLVVTCDLPARPLLQIADKLYLQHIPLLVVKISGFIGYIRLQVAEHVVVESHPDETLPDLRLDRPWTQLDEFLSEESARLSTMTRTQHGHTPYPVILHHYLNMWRKDHEGTIPTKYSDKKLFKSDMTKGVLMRENNPEVPEDEENWAEAATAVNTVVRESGVPSKIKDIINDPAAVNVTSKSSPFWVMAGAVREFVGCAEEGDGLLPVSGVIPDMFSDSERYIKLQNIYREKASLDAEAVYRRVQQTLDSLGKPQDSIPENEVKRFCKESASLRLLRGSSLAQEYHGKSDSNLSSQLDDPDSDAIYYLILRAADRFVSERGVSPGAATVDIESDIGLLKSCLNQVVADAGITITHGQYDEHVHEVCRYGGAELHSVAAFLGGVAGHEIIKLLTRQYVPIDNVVVYNATNSTTSKFKV